MHKSCDNDKTCNYIGYSFESEFNDCVAYSCRICSFGTDFKDCVGGKTCDCIRHFACGCIAYCNVNST